VYRVAENFLCLAWVGRCDGRRCRQVVVFLGSQPAETVAQMHTSPELVSGVGPAAVEGVPGIDDSGAGGHLRVGELVLARRRLTGLLCRRHLAVGPPVAPGCDPGSAVRAREVDKS
jgi:hypothetical protein